MRFTKIVSFVLFLSLIVFGGVAANAGESVEPVQKTYTLAELQADFQQMQKIIESENPLIFADKNELDKLFQSQYSLLREGMTELEFYRVLSPIVAAVRCGHTNLCVSASYEKVLQQSARYIPLRILIRANKMYVREDLSAASLPPGAEILLINGQPVAEIIATLLQNATADGYNETKKYYILNHWFNALYYYYIDTPERFTITYLTPGSGESQEVTVEAIQSPEMDMTPMNIYYSSRFSGELYTGEFYDDYAVLTIKTFGLKGGAKYKAFLKNFFTELASRQIDNLIVDVRGNWGGPTTPAAQLLAYLISEPFTYFDRSVSWLYFRYKWWPVKPQDNAFDGKVYVLMNGASFSTTGHFLAHLKHTQRAQFIGEESGGSYICSAMYKNYTLKHTKLRFYSARDAFMTTVDSLPLGRGIMPDFEVIPSLDEYLKEVDVQMKKAVELIKQGQ